MKPYDHYLRQMRDEAAADQEPITVPDQLTVSTTALSAKNHALCDGTTAIAVVLGGGYPVGTGWSPHTEAYAREIAHRFNTQPGLLDALTLADRVLRALTRSDEYIGSNTEDVITEALAKAEGRAA